jgi:predicted site-specific integrase-resolvase
LQDSLGLTSGVASRITIAYARVSASDQKEDLDRQRQRLDDYCAQEGKHYEVIDDLGSGLNYKKRGLKKLIHLILGGRVDKLILTHKDRPAMCLKSSPCLALAYTASGLTKTSY